MILKIDKRMKVPKHVKYYKRQAVKSRRCKMKAEMNNLIHGGESLYTGNLKEFVRSDTWSEW